MTHTSEAHVTRLLSALRAVAFAGAAVLLAGCGGGGAGGGGSGRVSNDLAAVETSGAASTSSQPGDFAADYLRGRNFRSLRIEVDYPAGRPPAQAALDLLVERVAARCDKPDGVSVVLDDEIPPSEFPPVLDGRDLEALEEAHRTYATDLAAGVVTMYVLCVPGHSADDTAEAIVRGMSFTGRSLALFLDATEQGGNPYVTTEEVQGLVLVHEAGHLIGLVNGGVPMVDAHEDPDHPHHDVDPASAMYFAPIVPRSSPNIGEPGFAEYGPECVRDIQAFGGQ